MSNPESKDEAPKKTGRKLVALSTRMTAMVGIEKIMTELSPEDRRRVAMWFWDEYQLPADETAQ